jgi:hypothetical protein
MVTLVSCSEHESACHLFHDYVVARRVWQLISEAMGVHVGVNYESVARLWPCNKKFGILNMITSVVFWCIWKLRNVVYFQGVA